MPKFDGHYLNYHIKEKNGKATTGAVVFKDINDYRYILRLNAYLRRVIKHITELHAELSNAPTIEMANGNKTDHMLTLIRYYVLSYRLSYGFPNNLIRLRNGSLSPLKHSDNRADRKRIVFGPYEEFGDDIFVSRIFISEMKKILPRSALYYSKIKNVSLPTTIPVGLCDIGPKKTRLSLRIPKKMNRFLGEAFYGREGPQWGGGVLHQTLRKINTWYALDDDYHEIFTPSIVDMKKKFKMNTDFDDHMDFTWVSFSFPTNLTCNKTKEVVEKISILSKISGKITMKQKMQIFYDIMS